jgi:hypothetical protein
MVTRSSSSCSKRLSFVNRDILLPTNKPCSFEVFLKYFHTIYIHESIQIIRKGVPITTCFFASSLSLSPYSSLRDGGNISLGRSRLWVSLRSCRLLCGVRCVCAASTAATHTPCPPDWPPHEPILPCEVWGDVILFPSLLCRHPPAPTPAVSWVWSLQGILPHTLPQPLPRPPRGIQSW